MYVVCTCVWDETPSYLHQEGGRARYQQSLIMSAWLDGLGSNEEKIALYCGRHGWSLVCCLPLSTG